MCIADNAYLHFSDMLSQWFDDNEYRELAANESLFLPESDIELLNQWEITPYLIAIQATAPEKVALGIGDIVIDATTNPKTLHEVNGHLIFFMNSLFMDVFIENENRLTFRQSFQKGVFVIVTDAVRKAEEWHYWLREQTANLEVVFRQRKNYHCTYKSNIEISEEANLWLVYIEVEKGKVNGIAHLE